MPSSFPAPAIEWMCPAPESDVAVIGPTRDLVGALLEAGHRVTALDRSLVALNRVLDLSPDLVPIAATAEAIPFEPHAFDTVVCMQNLHRMAPGLALPELARVLRPDGQLVIVYTTRDDTVPWVKRLAALLRDVDPTAMQGDYGVDSLDTLAEFPYFGALESRSFRTWVPVERGQLVGMVARRQAVQELDDERRSDILDAVGALYDGTARAPRPLLLPYQATCWRASVNHERLEFPATPDAGLRIL